MERILIIEDEPSIAELERDYLELNQYEADIAATGQEGLDRLKTNAYRLVLLDLMLPDMDGYEVCRKIREVSEIPIIMVTAKNEDIDMIRGLGRGADDYIAKPFNPNQLIARVKAHIARYDRLTSSGPGKGEDIRIGDLLIQPGTRKVFEGNQEKTLTAKEFDLLLFMAASPNQVFSKEHLLEQVWGFDFYGDVTTVTVHIRRLREKIEKDPSEPDYIETVWGVGYRFKR
ncbi:MULTISPECIES: response regulator transcription factor [Cytobacillus]|uniref:Response regulator transcription factor n=1 Tax=Cytobacillus firmus TaxID=1399 RepID=A0AA46PUK9_CYTFI|nr:MULTISPECIES: response regulator transcription factor [Cytobacillus]MCC3649101.1 response regulator transcription factor [Cytobacillus oceanisediminis]UYG97392.1 response regulator transcription factor [Cytobacillus firmus]